MKAHITDAEQAYAQIEAHYKKQLALESAKAGILIGNTALKMAVNNFGDAIRSATTFEELQKAAFEMLEWCETKKCEDLQEGAENDPDSTGVEPSNK